MQLNTILKMWTFWNDILKYILLFVFPNHNFLHHTTWRHYAIKSRDYSTYSWSTRYTYFKLLSKLSCKLCANHLSLVEFRVLYKLW